MDGPQSTPDDNELPEVDIDGADGSSGSRHRSYSSLRHALEAHRIPAENHALIRRFCEAIGVVKFEERGSYLKAVRPDGGPALQINSGWTNGFLSEEEVREAVGDDAAYWPSGRGTGQWGVTHPIHAMRDGGRDRKQSKSDFGICPSCFLGLPATRVCDNCGT